MNTINPDLSTTDERIFTTERLSRWFDMFDEIRSTKPKQEEK